VVVVQEKTMWRGETEKGVAMGAKVKVEVVLSSLLLMLSTFALTVVG
jgi:hypothetical protein